jgi:predicted dehydrogenase
MKPEMGPPDTKLYEFPGPDESWRIEMTGFEEDIRQQRKPDAGLAEARAALQIVEQIYRRSGFDFDSTPTKP